MKTHTAYIESIPVDSAPIPNFPRYFATRDGEIFSHIGRPKKRKFGRNSCGYPICSMKNKEGKVRFVMVHRIIALLFVDGDKSLEVNHIDMDKTNCKAANLEWVSKSTNHLKGRASNPDWVRKVAKGIRRPVQATNAISGEKHDFDSVKSAAIWAGNANASGNISKACRSGIAAYGYYWKKS